MVLRTVNFANIPYFFCPTLFIDFRVSFMRLSNNLFNFNLITTLICFIFNMMQMKKSILIYLIATLIISSCSNETPIKGDQYVLKHENTTGDSLIFIYINSIEPKLVGESKIVLIEGEQTISYEFIGRLQNNYITSVILAKEDGSQEYFLEGKLISTKDGKCFLDGNWKKHQFEDDSLSYLVNFETIGFDKSVFDVMNHANLKVREIVEPPRVKPPHKKKDKIKHKKAEEFPKTKSKSDSKFKRRGDERKPIRKKDRI